MKTTINSDFSPSIVWLIPGNTKEKMEKTQEMTGIKYVTIVELQKTLDRYNDLYLEKLIANEISNM